MISFKRLKSRCEISSDFKLYNGPLLKIFTILSLICFSLLYWKTTPLPNSSTSYKPTLHFSSEISVDLDSLQFNHSLPTKQPQGIVLPKKEIPSLPKLQTKISTFKLPHRTQLLIPQGNEIQAPDLEQHYTPFPIVFPETIQRPMILFYSFGEITSLKIKSTQSSPHFALTIGNEMRKKVLLFDIQVDGKKGEIFWIRQNAYSEIPELNYIAKKFIKTIQFITSNQKILTGQIEIHFQWDKNWQNFTEKWTANLESHLQNSSSVDF